MRIGVDAMGGDKAPDCTVDGAVMAVNELGVHVVLEPQACDGLVVFFWQDRVVEEIFYFFGWAGFFSFAGFTKK